MKEKHSLLDLAEDLLDDHANPIQSKASTHLKTPRLSKSYPNEKIPPVISKSLAELAQQMDSDRDALAHWYLQQEWVPQAILLSLLQSAKRLQLDPLLQHIDCEWTPEEGWQVYISVDGWIHLIHRQRSFAGIQFQQASEECEGLPIWMECSIYRRDLTLPVTVREYLCEVRSEHPSWRQIPRRMLRHKTLQQCARLAFGIQVAQVIDSGRHRKMNGARLSSPQSTAAMDSKLILKQKIASALTPKTHATD